MSADKKFEAQRTVIKSALEQLETTLMQGLGVSIKNLYECAISVGISPELVTAEIDEYRKRLPNLRLEIALEGLPTKERRH